MIANLISIGQFEQIGRWANLLVEGTVNDMENMGFDSWAGHIGHIVAIAATFFRSCGVRVLRRGDDRSCHSLQRLGVTPRVS